MNLNEYPNCVHGLGPRAARNLSNATKTIPMMESITPRWLLTFLPWVSVEAGVYRVNKVKRIVESDDCGECRELLPECAARHLGEHEIPRSFPNYEECPREYTLSLVQTILRLNGQVVDLFNSPINQMQEQMRITIETIKEKQEWEIINNSHFGLVNSVAPTMRIQSRHGSPTPDDMDELLSKVWKKPAYYLAHPKTIAAFGRECTRRGVPPVTINLFGSPFITWRGVPIVPSDKLCMDKILLMRVGESEQGVVGLHQPSVIDETGIPSMSVRFAGIDNMGIASYIMTLYFSAAVLTDDALGMLENIEVSRYHEYE